VRVYVPATINVLQAALAGGAADPAGRRLPPGLAFAVTSELREWYASGDTEELEYAAMTMAARASVGLLAMDVTAPRRRVVVAAEVDDAAVRVVTTNLGGERGRIEVTNPIRFAQIAAFHVDGAEAVAAVSAAAASPDDDWAADEASDHELLWYATQEIEDAIADVIRTTETGDSAD